MAGRMPFRVWLALWWDKGPWILRPPSNWYRCAMGYPFGESLRCRRRVVLDDDLWCPKHKEAI